MHAPYCRDALTAVLTRCPAISSVALRIHGESGIAEGSYDFWRTVFDGVKRCGREVEIDLHAKGIDATMIESALATGMPVNVSPKYWAEHLGMPYHQAAIRELEMPVTGRTGAGLMTLSEGARSFTRYGNADLMRENRRYPLLRRARCTEGEVRHIWWRLCRHFDLIPPPQLAFTQGYRHSWGSRRSVMLNADELTWQLVAHELAHAIAGKHHGFWHGKHHDQVVAQVVAHIQNKKWHRGAIGREMRRRRTK
jgi:hypothetical protein